MLFCYLNLNHAHFPTPEVLWNRTFAEQNAWRDRFAAVPFEDRGGYFQGRYYQDKDGDQTTLDEYIYTPDDSVMVGEEEAGKRYEEKDFNKIIEITERERKRVQIFMEQINPKEKTIVFCANQAHALAVRDLINQMKTSKDPNSCVRVTADDGARGEEFLREFQDNEKSIPTILTTSQKLSTGVDLHH